VDSLKSLWFALFFLFPMSTVIFEEQSPFRQSSGDGWWNQTREYGLPPLLLEKLFRGCDWFPIAPQTGTP